MPIALFCGHRSNGRWNDDEILRGVFVPPHARKSPPTKPTAMNSYWLTRTLLTPMQMIMVLPSSPGCIDVCRGRDYQERTDTSFDANHVRTADEAVRKCSGSMSLESDVPPKRLKLGPLKGWGVEKDGVSMSAVE
ncbi:hypothetical protein C8J57DRAFT_1243988 [Mycena rebaudengoi]|nr:hypothetical protein C8J57DRAFT_1243988 [Mycena rebaudengoi]